MLDAARNAGEDGGAAVEQFTKLASNAPKPDDRCLALSMAACAAEKVDSNRAFELWGRLRQDANCEPFFAKALFHQAQLRFESGVLAGLALTERLFEKHANSYWARRGVEMLFSRDEQLCAEGMALGPMLLKYYEHYKHTPIAGHLLFYSAKWYGKAHWEGRWSTCPPKPAGRRRMARVNAPKAYPKEVSYARRCVGHVPLYLLLLVVDYHPDSPLWDDALWAAADVLHDLGYHGDEALLLEQALLPHPGWGTDALAGFFVQKVRFRLAEIYLTQGRFEDALAQLALVVNFHPSLRLKDDAMWKIAGIYGALGNEGKKRKALRFLLDNFPWSRYAEEAKKRLGAP